MSGKRVKVALIGAGGWGKQHARIFHNHQDVDFCAIVGRNLEKTMSRAQSFGTKAYTSIEQMLIKEQPDLVSLCLPNQSHFEATLQVIQAGVPLFVEKPLVFDLNEADILLNEAAKRNLFFAINFNHRYAVPVQMANQAIKENKLGELVSASWHFGGEGKSDHPHANLIETQCHGFDMLEHLCGPIESVMAQMTNKTGKGYSTLVLALQFVNGAIGSLVGSYDSSYAYPEAHKVEVNGTHGHVVIDDTVRRFTYQERGNETAEVWQAGYFNDKSREFHRTFDFHIDHVLEALKNGQEPPIHANAGYRALKLAYSSIESFRTGNRIMC
ncbi:Gfo/Idh/MocA family protein [Paenibacillus agricola]|uniref:Gfo/Idh/MocA family oxidoreductase n=1 Tax=Paenibacillus agricola TaxID=2716264 RepID=A0ABX0JB51_9BACL|nr:Gfo/Idh/MocA family oxidoreductase [Paenibacillus agricola]NHN33727.1 Gfo/Idh/MocA family oxidoreductase [Paenibacillus agricola]